MLHTCLIDTSVLLNILNVDGYNQHYNEIIDKFEEYQNDKDDYRFIIPLVAILETGNHIGKCKKGRIRRKKAQEFIAMIGESFAGESPFEVTRFDLKKQWENWIADFPDYAGRNKNLEKTTEGTSLGDLSIIKEYESIINFNKKRKSKERVFIWSIDQDLTAYDYQP